MNRKARRSMQAAIRKCTVEGRPLSEWLHDVDRKTKRDLALVPDLTDSTDMAERKAMTDRILAENREAKAALFARARRGG